MNNVRLSPERQRAICEDLLAIGNAGRLDELWEARRRAVREHRLPSPWQQVEIDRLAQEASSLIGGSRSWWQEAAAAALGFRTRADVCAELVCTVADDVREQESQRAAPPARLTVNSRKRGWR
ncbi:MAG: hypothetical protein EBU81_02920 [Proteobacteria bacterium]|nr:hypothetical protein [Pseudomonadota bacterium]